MSPLVKLTSSTHVGRVYWHSIGYPLARELLRLQMSIMPALHMSKS